MQNPFYISRLLCAAGIAFSLQAFASPEQETKRLHQWLDERYEQELQRSPTSLTSLGRKDLYDQVDDYSREAQLDYLKWIAQSGKQLADNFDYDKLRLDARYQLVYEIRTNN